MHRLTHSFRTRLHIIDENSVRILHRLLRTFRRNLIRKTAPSILPSTLSYVILLSI